MLLQFGRRGPLRRVEWDQLLFHRLGQYGADIPIEKAKRMSEEELEGKIITGCLVNNPREDYYTKYKRIIDAHKEG